MAYLKHNKERSAEVRTWGINNLAPRKGSTAFRQGLSRCVASFLIGASSCIENKTIRRKPNRFFAAAKFIYEGNVLSSDGIC